MRSIRRIHSQPPTSVGGDDLGRGLLGLQAVPGDQRQGELVLAPDEPPPVSLERRVAGALRAQRLPCDDELGDLTLQAVLVHCCRLRSNGERGNDNRIGVLARLEPGSDSIGRPCRTLLSQ